VIEKCASIGQERSCDAIVAVGGGSVMDTAKVASVIMTNGANAHEFIGRDRIKNPGVFKVLIPTTAGTGSEWAEAAIVTDVSDGQKKPIFSRYMWPDLAIIDPVMSLGLPPRVTADTGIDALTHAIEAYAAWKANVVSDMFAEQAMQLIATSLRTAYAKGRRQIGARYNLSIAAALAIAAHTSSSAGLVHSLNYPLSVRAHVSHGTALAILLPHVMEFNLPACPDKYARVADIMGENVKGLAPMDAARKSVDAVRKLGQDLRLPQRMRDVGFEERDIEPALDFLFEYQVYGMENNPRDVTRDDIVEIYKAAL
jgi:alcohol dehydrogenase